MTKKGAKTARRREIGLQKRADSEREKERCPPKGPETAIERYFPTVLKFLIHGLVQITLILPSLPPERRRRTITAGNRESASNCSAGKAPRR